MAELDLQQADVKSVLRIMDVASEMRRHREQAEGELNVEEAKAKIREKILATAEITGEQLTPEEIDASIESFYSGLYRYEKPQRTLQYHVARLYVARGQIFRRVLLPVFVLLAIVFGIRGVSSVRQSQKQAGVEHQLNELPEKAKQLHSAALTLAKEEKAREKANDLFAQVQAALATKDLEKLSVLNGKFEALLKLLQQEYTVRIVNRQGRKSGIDRYFTSSSGRRVSGYYLILEAQDNNGNRIPIEIESKESGARGEVFFWGERVPKAIYHRVRRDKMKDGVLDEVLFAKKEQGYTEITVLMRDESGQPLKREAQITSW